MEVKRVLFDKICSVVKTAFREKRPELEADCLSGDIQNQICSAVEALFIQGLKEKYIRRNAHGKYPEPNFWPFISKHLHRNVIAQVKNLNQIKTDVGRSRVLIRLALIDGVVENYLTIVTSQKRVVRHYYTDRALMCDSELLTAVSHYLRALAKFKFTFPLNSSFLNVWTPSPLQLAGYTDAKQPTSVTAIRQRLSSGSQNGGSVEQSSLNGSSIDLSCAMEEVYDFSEMSSVAPSARLFNETSPPVSVSGCFISKGTNKVLKPVEQSVEVLASKELARCSTAAMENDSTSVLINSNEYEEDRVACPVKVDSKHMNLPEEGAYQLIEKESSASDVSRPSSMDEKNSDKCSYLKEDDDRAISISVTHYCRQSSACASKTLPLVEKYKTFAHVLIPEEGIPLDFLADGGISEIAECTPFQNEEQLAISGIDEEHILKHGRVSVGKEIPPDAVFIYKTDESESWQFPYLSQFAIETGLDGQNEQCNSCARRIGFENEPYKVCQFDGHYYCSACHVDDEFLIPARVIFNWDLSPGKVCRASKCFLSSIADRPLFNLNSLNPEIYKFSKALSEMRNLRLQMNHVAAYLLTCRRTVVDELNKRLWPKDYLFREVDLYSLTDLQLVSTGKLQRRLMPVLEFGIDHVLFNCRLCAQKGFICEVCNQPEVIYPFQLTTTYRCPTCYWVYHKACMQNGETCSRCARRDALAKEAESSSIDLNNTLPLEDV
uniref:RUN domain-containing protein n=1 Tax=Trichuris muris TaxID=70415 RepID=A0A5S6QA94_TRIMR